MKMIRRCLAASNRPCALRKHSTAADISSRSSLSRRRSSSSTRTSNNTATLVLLRHGQSTWNETPRFSGWCDAPLTQRGKLEAIEAGRLLRSRGFSHFDQVYTSTLQRAIVTCELALKEATESSSKNLPTITKAWQLNERHYGALQGRYKNDPVLIEKYGKEQLLSWRRDFHARPPPMEEDTSHEHYQPPPAPRTESLQDCQDRVLEYWYNVILPSLKSGSRTLLVAHANTIRALVSYLDRVPHDLIPKINIPNSVPCIYQLNADTGRAVSPVLNSHAGGTRGQWVFSAENYKRLKQKIGGTSGSFVRAIFEAWDANGDGVLSREEICNGLREIMDDSFAKDDFALAALAAKILEQVDVNSNNTLDLQEFDAFAVAAFQKFVPELVD